ncbi:helix-turn-helix domain-containing protein [Thalassobacillus cyri]|uniref:helix-turn-helix domain-containing protein n=1 Tax=Thalassobacillus cyri TaxID=571932 RepID=UPI001FE00211|nr:helix-turn-helix transcriptional regulator [Thalassobacillus cyri]
MERRLNKYLTQEEVAKRALIDRTCYSQIETGKRNPSIHIAINIAGVLDFDPLDFSEQSFDRSPEQTPFPSSVPPGMTTETGILYLYEGREVDSKQIDSFIKNGVRKKHASVFVGNPQQLAFIYEKAKKIFSATQMNDYLHFITRSEFNKLIAGEERGLKGDGLPQKGTLRIWMLENDGSEGDSIKDNFKNTVHFRGYENIFLIMAYEASKVSAADYIHLMKTYRYLMIDTEIIPSPLFQSNETPHLLPSLFRQKERDHG